MHSIMHWLSTEWGRFFPAPLVISHGAKVITILLIAYLLHHFIKGLIETGIRRVITVGAHEQEETLTRLFSRTFSTALWLAAAMMILSEVGINIGPLLAAAGIAGIAIGFGGQYLIRDVIAGLFIILENRYRIGDIVRIENVEGEVEDITLRMTFLRDMDGAVHTIPNGDIRSASNLSKHFSKVNFNVRIPYKASLEKAIEVINRVGKELAADPVWKGAMLKPPAFLRVEEFGDAVVILKVTGDTKPLKQWEVSGELRKRIKLAFDQENLWSPP